MSATTQETNNAPVGVNDLNSLKNFHFDTSGIDWRPFITDGCFYKLLDVNIEARTADMLVKFEPNAQCLYHRHVAQCASLVLEGDHVVIEPERAGGAVKTKPAGTFASGTAGEVHIEGGGPNGVVIYFSMRGTSDAIYDLLNPDLTLMKAITIQDFAKDLKYWSR